MSPWPLARGGRRRATCKPASARNVCFTLALLVMTALLVDPALPEDAGAGATGQSEIRLGMSADFSASARALSIELYRGAMAYLRPINNAGGVNGRRIAITAYDDQYEPDLRPRISCCSFPSLGPAPIEFHPMTSFPSICAPPTTRKRRD